MVGAAYVQEPIRVTWLTLNFYLNEVENAFDTSRTMGWLDPMVRWVEQPDSSPDLLKSRGVQAPHRRAF